MDLKQYFPYKTIRSGQEDILNTLNEELSKNNQIRYVVIEAGTGIGKSAIAKAISGQYRSSYLLTATKQLQNQYVSDFSNLSVNMVKGKANYMCSKNEGASCASGECKIDKSIIRDCVSLGQCKYYKAKNLAEASEMFVTSYSYFLLASSGVATKFAKRNAVIIDECHLIEDQLIEYAGFTLSRDKLNKKYFLCDPSNFRVFLLFNKKFKADGYDANKEWIKLTFQLITEKLSSYKNELSFALTANKSKMTADELTQLEEIDVQKISRMYDELMLLHDKIKSFLDSPNKDNWIISINDDSIKVQPLKIENLFHQYIDKFANSLVVFMSATILDKQGFCNDLGLDKDRTLIISKDSTFPSSLSPIVYDPIGSMNYKNLQATMPYIVQEIKDILARHPHEKGIIHTANYTIAQKIIDNIQSKRLVYRGAGESNELLYKMHVLSDDDNTVLVSPSLMTGIDLKDDLGRFQIIVKLPFISLADERVKRKMAIDKKWYLAKMMRDLVQACGRSTRSEDDWSITYVLDNSFLKFVKMSQKWLGNQFIKRIIDDSKFDINQFNSLINKKSGRI